MDAWHPRIYFQNGCSNREAPMGTRRHGQGSTCPPEMLQSAKFISSYRQTLSRPLFMHYFYNFRQHPIFCLAGEIWRVGVACIFCVLKAKTKKVVNFLRKKVHPSRQACLGLRLWICPPLKKILRAPMEAPTEQRCKQNFWLKRAT